MNLEATSNENFDEKIDSVCKELGSEFGLPYAVLAIATDLRMSLTRDEVLLAIGDPSNEALNRLQRLQNQHLIIVSGDQLQLRHRVVAERVVDYYRSQMQLSEPIEGLLWAMATKVCPSMSRHARQRKLLTRLLNHDSMIRLTPDRSVPRKAYALIEDVLNWDYHYFLQRGSFEVEVGDIELAKNFLDQARGIAPNDYMVQTEWAYMTLKRASSNPIAGWAKDSVDEAFSELSDAIRSRGKDDYYPYHILGSQGLSWIRRAPMAKSEKVRKLAEILEQVKQGLTYHPRRRELKRLTDDVQTEYLMQAVMDPPQA